MKTSFSETSGSKTASAASAGSVTAGQQVPLTLENVGNAVLAVAKTCRCKSVIHPREAGDPAHLEVDQKLLQTLQNLRDFGWGAPNGNPASPASPAAAGTVAIGETPRTAITAVAAAHHHPITPHEVGGSPGSPMINSPPKTSVGNLKDPANYLDIDGSEVVAATPKQSVTLDGGETGVAGTEVEAEKESAPSEKVANPSPVGDSTVPPTVENNTEVELEAGNKESASPQGVEMEVDLAGTQSETEQGSAGIDTEGTVTATVETTAQVQVGEATGNQSANEAPEAQQAEAEQGSAGIDTESTVTATVETTAQVQVGEATGNQFANEQEDPFPLPDTEALEPDAEATATTGTIENPPNAGTTLHTEETGTVQNPPNANQADDDNLGTTTTTTVTTTIVGNTTTTTITTQPKNKRRRKSDRVIGGGTLTVNFQGSSREVSKRQKVKMVEIPINKYSTQQGPIAYHKPGSRKSKEERENMVFDQQGRYYRQFHKGTYIDFSLSIPTVSIVSTVRPVNNDWESDEED